MQIKIFIAVILMLGVGGVYVYINKLQKDNAILQANQIKLEEAVQDQQQLIAQQKQDFEDIMAANKKLDEQTKILQKEVAKLDDKFSKINASGKKRDIGDLALKKPKPVEKVINNASNNALRCVEIAMGSPLTEKETNATKPSEINSECPSLANPSYVPAE